MIIILAIIALIALSGSPSIGRVAVTHTFGVMARLGAPRAIHPP